MNKQQRVFAFLAALLAVLGVVWGASAAIKNAQTLIGGGAKAVDAIDGAALLDHNMVITRVLAGAAASVYFHVLDDDSAAAESSPTTIQPDANGGNKRWTLGKVIAHGLDANDQDIDNVADIALDTISSDAGTSVNVVLGADAGDDFLVDTTKLVVEGDTGNVGIGTATPASKLYVQAAEAGSFTPDAAGDDFVVENNSYAGMSLIGSAATGGIIYFGDPADPNPGAIIYYNSASANADKMYFRANDSTRMVIDSSGNVGIGTASPNQRLTVENSMSLKEIANATADTAAYGQIWVHDTTPNELWFTDDAGTDTQISPHPLDAPTSMYIHGPGIDWISKRVQKYLGVIFWQTIDGSVIEETFDAYNARRRGVEGHIDLVKRDWAISKLADLKAKKKKEGKKIKKRDAYEELALEDAFESIEITESVQVGEEQEYSYEITESGEVVVSLVTVPIMTTQGTGEFRKKLKQDVTFDLELGKFRRLYPGVSRTEDGKYKKELTDAEVEALTLDAPEMPPWMKEWVAIRGSS